MLRNSLINFSSALLCLIPFSLLTGPLLPDLFLSLIVIIFVFISIKEKLWNYYNNKFFIFFCIFYLYILSRSLFSGYQLLSLESSLFYMRFGIFSLAVWFLINNNTKLIKIFTSFILITFIIALLDGIYQYIYDINIFGIYIPGVTRMTLLLNDKMILGGYLARLFPLIFALLIIDFKANKLKILLFSLLIVVTDVLVYATGERTALFLFILATVLLILLLSEFKRLRIITFILSLIIITVVTIFNAELRERNIDHTINQIYSNGEMRLFSLQHQSHYLGAWKMYIDNPIFGVGPKLFRIYCDEEMYNIDQYTCSTHPHNTYLQVLAELGTVGFIFILILFSYVCIKSFEKLKSNIFKTKTNISDYQACLLICFMLTLWPAFPTQGAFNNWINIIYFLPVGFYLQSLYNIEIKKD